LTMPEAGQEVRPGMDSSLALLGKHSPRDFYLQNSLSV
jgi:hypothetical protein